MKTWRRSGKKNRHHIVNKTNGGTSISSNIIKLDKARHCAWHFLFKNMSFREVIELLERTIEYQERKPH